MSTVALFTAKGAPGATTDAMLVAALWPRRVLLIDCDPAGGDVALRLPSSTGTTLDVSTGMLSLLPLARRPLQPTDVLSHAQVALGGTELLAGIASPDQAIAAGTVWGSLAELFAGLPDHDAIIDLGRLHPTSAVLPVAQRADLAVCVVHASLSGTIAARSRLRTVLPALGREGYGPRCGFVVRAADRGTAESAVRVLAEEFEDLSYFGWLPDDPAGASLFEGGRVSRPERTLLVRSGAELVAQLDAALPPGGKRGGASTTSPPGGDSGSRRSRRGRRSDDVAAGSPQVGSPAAAPPPPRRQPARHQQGPAVSAPSEAPPTGTPVAYDPPPVASRGARPAQDAPPPDPSGNAAPAGRSADRAHAKRGSRLHRKSTV